MQEWISVKDRLPAEHARCDRPSPDEIYYYSKSDNVLVYCPKESVYVNIAQLVTEKGERYWEAYEPTEIPFDDVSHWMPLPEPPKE